MFPLYNYNQSLKNMALVEAVVDREADAVLHFLENGADIHYENDACLLNAVYLGYKDMVALLLEKGADIHVDNEQPLVIAVRARDRELIDFLVKKGANIDVVLENKNGALDKESLAFIAAIKAEASHASIEKRRVNTRPVTTVRARP